MVVVVIRVVVAVMLGVACDQPHFQQHSYILKLSLPSGAKIYITYIYIERERER